MVKERLDILVVKRQIAESRSLAQRLILSGQIFVNGEKSTRSAQSFQEDVEITLATPPLFVSRGGDKLLTALQAFNCLDLTGLVCVDVGSSTGGFTDCLLQHGARKIFAVDVGYGELHWKIRQDPRVVVMERTNARFLEGFPERIDLVVVDVSFISLRIILATVKKWFSDGKGDVIALIKPQFEAGKKEVDRCKGVIKDPLIHQKVIKDITTFAEEEGFVIKGVVPSSIAGAKGNQEFLVYLTLRIDPHDRT
jgi:23S rRNA (cytidine1920-2'-O)/16S rRNA (cytidine1409-2'-O)-methyltransferase